MLLWSLLIFRFNVSSLCCALGLQADPLLFLCSPMIWYHSFGIDFAERGDELMSTAGMEDNIFIESTGCFTAITTYIDLLTLSLHLTCLFLSLCVVRIEWRLWRLIWRLFSSIQILTESISPCCRSYMGTQTGRCSHLRLLKYVLDGAVTHAGPGGSGCFAVWL